MSETPLKQNRIVSIEKLAYGLMGLILLAFLIGFLWLWWTGAFAA